MRPVNRRDLLVLGAGLAVAAWLVVRASYGALPALRWWLPVPLGVLALAEALVSTYVPGGGGLVEAVFFLVLFLALVGRAWRAA